MLKKLLNFAEISMSLKLKVLSLKNVNVGLSKTSVSSTAVLWGETLLRFTKRINHRQQVVFEIGYFGVGFLFQT